MLTFLVAFRPGSEAEIKGYRPSYYVKYNSATPYADRVTEVAPLSKINNERCSLQQLFIRPFKVLEWLDYGVDQRPTFLTLYFEGVDSQGHSYGPDSVPNVKDLVRVPFPSIHCWFGSQLSHKSSKQSKMWIWPSGNSFLG